MLEPTVWVVGYSRATHVLYGMDSTEFTAIIHGSNLILV